MPEQDGWGHEQGRLVFSRLLKAVEANPETEIFLISLEGVRRTDASFPRESVVELARRYREHRGFCLVGVQDEDLLDNWGRCRAQARSTDRRMEGSEAPDTWSTAFSREQGAAGTRALRKLRFGVERCEETQPQAQQRQYES